MEEKTDWCKDLMYYSLRFGEAPNQEQVNEFKQLCLRFFAQSSREIIGQCVVGYGAEWLVEGVHPVQASIAPTATTGQGSL